MAIIYKRVTFVKNLKFRIMENIFKIPVYNNNLELIREDEYPITYLKGLKHHHFRIVVNGFLTKQVINIVDYNQGYKDQILKAISEYKNNDLKIVVKKRLTLNELRSLYAKNIIKRIENYLLPINKETSRDKLTQYNLI